MPKITLENGSVIIDGLNVGRPVDALANYPGQEKEIREAMETGQPVEVDLPAELLFDSSPNPPGQTAEPLP